MNTTARLAKELSHLKENDLFRSLKLKSGLVDFSSNDYLGIRQNEFLLKQISEQPMESFGSGGSRLLSGNFSLAEELESLLAEVHNKESALLFNSGYVANLAFFSTLPSRNSTILYDEKIHACIKDGMRLSLAKKISFKHNDISQLEQRLKSCDNEIYVAIESVYSMDGDSVPLHEIAHLCSKYGANLVVDEAHSTGIYGKYGAGLVTELRLDHLVFAKIHTFGKAIGAHGACIVSSETVKDYLINKARPFIFTTAMPLHNVASLLLIYRYLAENYLMLQAELNKKIELYNSLISNTSEKNTNPICVVIIPGNEQVRAISLDLEKQGLDVRPVMSPTVPLGEERLRICLHGFNTDQEIKTLVNYINQLK